MSVSSYRGAPPSAPLASQAAPESASTISRRDMPEMAVGPADRQIRWNGAVLPQEFQPRLGTHWGGEIRWAGTTLAAAVRRFKVLPDTSQRLCNVFVDAGVFDGPNAMVLEYEALVELTKHPGLPHH